MQFELCGWTEGLAPSLAKNANDARIVRYLNEGFPNPYTPEDARRFIAAANSGKFLWNKAIVVDGGAVGCVSLSRGHGVLRTSAEIGYWLHPACWGRGIMTVAVGSACADVFGQTDIVRIQAQVFSENLASARVLQKCGFVQEGVLRRSVCKEGRYYDLLLYGLLKEEVR